jgi:hypothetical protein
MPKIADFYAELGLKKDKYDKGMKDAEKAPSKLGEAFKGLAIGMASAFSVTALISFAKMSIQAYDIQAKGEAALLHALGGRVTVQKELLDQATELQGKTLFGDEATASAMKQLAVMKLNKDMIKSLIPVIQDFATVNNMDLDMAAKLVAKSVATSTNALGRYGVEIESTMTMAQKAAEVQRIFNERYGGQAQLAASVGTGAMTQLKNAFGDFTEIVGKMLAQNTQGYFKSMADGVSDLNKQLSSDFLSKWEKFIAVGSKLVAENDPTGMTSVAVNLILNQKIKENEANQKLADSLETLNNLRKNAKQLIADEVARLAEISKARQAELDQIRKLAAERVEIAKDMANKLEMIRAESIDLSNIGNVGNNLLGNFDPNVIDIDAIEIEPIEIPINIEKFNESMLAVKERTELFVNDMNAAMS